MPKFVKNPKDFIAGFLFLTIAATFAAAALRVPVGTAFRMGPGYFPLMLTVGLGALGALLMASGLRLQGPPLEKMSWRGLFFISLAIVFFSATLNGLGFLPALSVTVFLATLASRMWRLGTSLLITVALALLSTAVFIYGLRLPLALVGPWLGAG